MSFIQVTTNEILRLSYAMENLSKGSFIYEFFFFFVSRGQCVV